MVVTVMRKETVLVEQNLPSASEIQKLENKRLVAQFFVGKPLKVNDESPQIQANDQLINLNEVGQFISLFQGSLPESDRNKITYSIRGDKKLKMGIIQDLKQELRKNNALKINYSTLHKEEF